MIIKGNIRTDGKALGNYLLSEGRYAGNREKNEQIEIWEAFGVEQGDTLQEILADFQHSAAGSQCQKPLFHVQFRTADGEALTQEQWFEAVNRLEERLELTGHERVIVTHRLNGQDHVHVAWNRMDPETGKAAELHYYKHKCTDLARELERDFGLRQLSNDRKKGNLSRDEEQQALRHGKAPQEIKEELRACWREADNGHSFAAALDDRGYLLAKGDRRDFVIVGQEGDLYVVSRVTGCKAAEVRDRLADLDRESLPGVEEARGIQHDRAHGVTPAHDLLKWEDDLARAGVEKAEREDDEARQLREKQRAAHLGATLYNRADMVHMQRDAMRHLEDAHRHQKQQAEREQQEQTERQRDEPPRLDQHEQARQDKQDRTEQTDSRTEQTDSQQRRAAKDLLRELWENRSRSTENEHSMSDYERERDRER